MTIAVDWPNSAITVNQSDCTFVSGTFYTFSIDTLWTKLIDLEDDVDGIVWPRTQDNAPPNTIAGTTLARQLSIRSPYTVEFLPDSQWTVQLEDANTNVWSVGDGILVQNQVQVIPTNSAGLAFSTDTTRARKVLTNRQELVDTGTDVVMRTWDDDGTTVLEENIVTDDADAKPDLTTGVTKRGVST